MREFHLKIVNDLIIVVSLCKGSRNALPVRLGLDTGSPMTILSREITLELGLAPDPSIAESEIVSFAVKSLAIPVIIPRIVVFNSLLENIKCVSLAMPETSTNIDGLLGMNILKTYFNVCIDFTNKVLKIERR